MGIIAQDAKAEKAKKEAEDAQVIVSMEKHTAALHLVSLNHLYLGTNPHFSFYFRSKMLCTG
jgi:hypothetical protein